MTQPLHPADHPVFAAFSPEAKEALRFTLDLDTKHYDTDLDGIEPFTVTSVDAPRIKFSRFISDDETRRPHSSLNVHGCTRVIYDPAFNTVVMTNDRGEQITLNIFPAEGGMKIDKRS